MKRPTEHKTVQARILGYAQEIDWTYVPCAEAEWQCGFGARGMEWCSSRENKKASFKALLRLPLRAIHLR